MPQQISRESYESRLKVLCTPTTRRSWPRKSRDRWILLHSIARRLPEGETANEREFTRRIEEWLAHLGDGFDLDAVSLRRHLVEEGFVDRDPAGLTYLGTHGHARRVTFAEGVAAIDDLALIAAARADAAAKGEKHLSA